MKVSVVSQAQAYQFAQENPDKPVIVFYINADGEDCYSTVKGLDELFKYENGFVSSYAIVK